MDPLKFATFVLTKFKERIKIEEISIDNKAFSLHYRLTALMFLIFSTVIAVTPLFAKESQFTCLKSVAPGDGGKIEQKVIDSYCWIEGTFIFPRSIMDSIKLEEKGLAVPHTGIWNSKNIHEKRRKELPEDEIMTTTYYQWVPIVLFLQSLTYYFPHYLWKKVFENGMQKKLIEQLYKPVYKTKDILKHRNALIEFLYINRGAHNSYALKYFFCEILNLLHLLCQFAFMDWFLGGKFWSYGWKIVTATEPRPMEKVFPTLTKCRFHRYGPSGDIQAFDNLCILPLNIFNEKAYLLLWWWMLFVGIITSIAIVYNAFSILFYKARYYSLSAFNRMVPEGPYKKVLDSISYGDWFLLYLLSKNLDPFHYREIIVQLAERIDKGKSGRTTGTGASLLNAEERSSSSRGTSTDPETPI